MPAPQQKMGEGQHHEEDDHAREREQPQGREEAWDVQAILALDDAVGEARARAGRARRDLGDGGANERQASGDLETGEEVGESGRAAQIPERLHPRQKASHEGGRPFRPRGPVEIEQFEKIAVDRLQPKRGVGQDGKERHDPGAGQHREILRQVDEQERRDRHHRRHLQHDGIGIKRVLDHAREAQEHREGHAAGNGEDETQERGLQRREQRHREDRPVLDARGPDGARRRRDIGRHLIAGHIGLPEPDRQAEE